jgi:hypothetical protein
VLTPNPCPSQRRLILKRPAAVQHPCNTSPDFGQHKGLRSAHQRHSLARSLASVRDSTLDGPPYGPGSQDIAGRIYLAVPLSHNCRCWRPAMSEPARLK